MDELLTALERTKDIGATALLIGVALWFGFKYVPDQSKRQGETIEVMRNSVEALNNNTEALQMVSERDKDTREALERIEQRVDAINLDMHDLKNQQRKD